MTDYEKDIYRKTAHFCAYRERSVAEVNKKLRSLDIGDETALLIVRKLIADNFVSDERFAEQYTIGKLTNNHWGKLKIKTSLKQKGIGISLVERALDSIDEEVYKQVLDKLIEKRIRLTKAKNIFEKRKKLANYLIQKGFESYLVWDKVNNAIK